MARGCRSEKVSCLTIYHDDLLLGCLAMSASGIEPNNIYVSPRALYMLHMQGIDIDIVTVVSTLTTKSIGATQADEKVDISELFHVGSTNLPFTYFNDVSRAFKLLFDDIDNKMAKPGFDPEDFWDNFKNMSNRIIWSSPKTMLKRLLATNEHSQ